MIATSFPNGVSKKYVDDTVNQALARYSHVYTARWDKKEATMTRLNAAAGITTDTTQFAYRGSAEDTISNPFDNIYPWSAIKLCNIDIDLYRALSPGETIRDCVTAWEGDPDFKYDHKNGVWRYSPEFWGRSYDDGTYRYFEVADRHIGGFIHYPESIKGRWHGVKKNVQIGEEAKDILLPLADQPPEADTVSIKALHEYAQNAGMTLDNIYTVDADTLLLVVEYANMNAQTAVGQGVASVYQAGEKHVTENVTEGKTVKIATTNKGPAQKGAIFAIGDANDRGLRGRAVITDIADADGTTTITLDRNVTITTTQFFNIHGMSNTRDETIGGKSGYIGTNGKCIAYYRGLEMWGNMFFYVLGAYRNGGTGKQEHIWIAKSADECDSYDALDETKHIDTGLALPARPNEAAFSGWVNKLGMHEKLSAPPFGTEINNGASDAKPVGDWLWMPASTVGPTVCILGGSASIGLSCGPFSASWCESSGAAWWNSCARPSLRNP